MKGITCQGLVKRADATKLLYLERTINIFHNPYRYVTQSFIYTYRSCWLYETCSILDELCSKLLINDAIWLIKPARRDAILIWKGELLNSKHFPNFSQTSRSPCLMTFFPFCFLFWVVALRVAFGLEIQSDMIIHQLYPAFYVTLLNKEKALRKRWKGSCILY